MMFWKTAILISLTFAIAYGETGSEKQPSPDSASLNPLIALPVYAVDTILAVDSLKLNFGDSVFIHSGEQYFRARVGNRECFVSRSSILAHADSLVVYQNLRLQPAGFLNPETSTAKMERQRCTMMTKNGTRCKRLALPGSDRCWQHKK